MTASDARTPAPPDSLTPRKRWAFRIAAVFAGLSLFAAFEVVCLLAGWGKPTDYPDPYVGFSEIHPLFVMDEGGEKYVIPRSRRGFFKPESFPVKKGPNTFRIFCLGGSTVQGRPYSTQTSFTKWLQLSLAAGDPSTNWEVVNCGGISYASYRLAPILRECRQYEPDLFILCTGHNEFLEERTYGHIKHAPRAIAGPARLLSRLRTVTLLREGVNRLTGRGDGVPGKRARMKSEVDALLDYRNGLKPYHRDPEFRKGVVEHFAFNLRRMIDMAEADGVPVVLVLPPSNLRDQPPFKSQHTAGLSPAERAQWKELTAESRSLYRSDLERAAELLERAAKIDPLHAATHYELGRCYDALWTSSLSSARLEQARREYWRALDLDVCPLRVIPPLRDAMRQVARETGTPLLDVHALLEGDCPGGILDSTFLVDHIHPSPLVGHRKIADALADLLKLNGWFHPAGDWTDRREAAYRAHRESLDGDYFQDGLKALNALRRWTKGRTDGPPVETREQGPHGRRANER